MSNGIALKAVGHGQHFGRLDEQEHRARIDETPDQPGTGDAIDLRARPRHPDRAALFIARRQFVGADQKPLAVAPGFEAAFEGFGGDSLVAQPCGDALREFLPFLADDDDGLPANSGAQVETVLKSRRHRGRQQARIGVEILIDADIDDGRRTRQADQTGQLRYGDSGC